MTFTASYSVPIHFTGQNGDFIQSRFKHLISVGEKAASEVDVRRTGNGVGICRSAIAMQMRNRHVTTITYKCRW